jgi:hypothetical protein
VLGDGQSPGANLLSNLQQSHASVNRRPVAHLVMPRGDAWPTP